MRSSNTQLTTFRLDPLALTCTAASQSVLICSGTFIGTNYRVQFSKQKEQKEFLAIGKSVVVLLFFLNLTYIRATVQILARSIRDTQRLVTRAMVSRCAQKLTKKSADQHAGPQVTIQMDKRTTIGTDDLDVWFEPIELSSFKQVDQGIGVHISAITVRALSIQRLEATAMNSRKQKVSMTHKRRKRMSAPVVCILLLA